MYKVLFAGAAEKYFRKIKEKGLKNAFQEALKILGRDPYIGELKRYIK